MTSFKVCWSWPYSLEWRCYGLKCPGTVTFLPPRRPMDAPSTPGASGPSRWNLGAPGNYGLPAGLVLGTHELLASQVVWRHTAPQAPTSAQDGPRRLKRFRTAPKIAQDALKTCLDVDFGWPDRKHVAQKRHPEATFSSNRLKAQNSYFYNTGHAFSRVRVVACLFLIAIKVSDFSPKALNYFAKAKPAVLRAKPSITINIAHQNTRSISVLPVHLMHTGTL